MAKQSLAGRAVLAVAFLVGFYGLALVVAGVLLYLPYAEWHYLGRVEIRLLVFALAAALAILAGIAPRFDDFAPPGPELRRKDQPRLFASLDGVASATKQAMPAEVFLAPDLNAFVAQRGGIMGIGSRRVMGLGLPLLQALTIKELEAVLAHEFGHFDAGDTALGPWLYKTRAAIERTLANLRRRWSVISLPFLWYGKAFLRLTSAVSRQQEFAADALAARTVGAGALASGLRTLHRDAAAFAPYWAGEVLPVLRNGYLPPLALGFGHFRAVPDIAEATGALLETEIREATADPYDTHPPLRERLAALAEDPAGQAPATQLAAISLLERTEELERELVTFLMPRAEAQRLKTATWEELPSVVWTPRWVELVAKNRQRLAGLTPEDLPALLAPPTGLAVRCGFAADRGVVMPQHVEDAKYLTMAALCVSLHGAGWVARSLPGEQVEFDRDGDRLRPMLALTQLAEGSLSAEDWHAQCAAAGISGQDFGLLAAVAALPAARGP